MFSKKPSEKLSSLDNLDGLMPTENKEEIRKNLFKILSEIINRLKKEWKRQLKDPEASLEYENILKQLEQIIQKQDVQIPEFYIQLLKK